MPKYEVVDKSTGARMSHSRAVEMMGSTLFDAKEDAEKWMNDKGLPNRTHEIREVTDASTGN